MKASNISAALLSLMLVSIVVSGEVLAEERPAETTEESFTAKDSNTLEDLTTNGEPEQVSCGSYSRTYHVHHSESIPGPLEILFEGDPSKTFGPLHFLTLEDCQAFIRDQNEQMKACDEFIQGLKSKFEEAVDTVWKDHSARMCALQFGYAGRQVKCGTCPAGGAQCKAHSTPSGCEKNKVHISATTASASGAGVCLNPSARARAGRSTVLKSMTCKYNLKAESFGTETVRCESC